MNTTAQSDQNVVSEPGGVPKKKTRAVKLAGLSAVLLLSGGMMFLPSVREALGADATGILRGLQERFAGSAPMAKPDPVRGVRVFIVAQANTALERSFTGTVAARYETAIGFRVGGKILRRAVEVGQTVRAGDALFVLDPADYRSAVSAAEATLLGAQAQAMQAAADERRQAQLLAQGWTTQAVYDRARAAAQMTQSQARAAADRLDLARNDLSYAELKAPHDGIVTGIRAEAGQVVPVGQPVLTLIRPGDREAVITVPEGQVANLRDWTATAKFWGRPPGSEPATLREVAPQADSASRTYLVRFSLPLSAETAELGSTVTIDLRREISGGAATIPSSALIFREGKASVWRVTSLGDRVESVVVLVERLGAETTDVKGLQSGDRIVSLGVHRLDSGALVRIVEGGTAPRSPSSASVSSAVDGGRS